MKESLKEKKTNLKDIFSKPKSTYQKAWEIIHDFYYLIYTHMDQHNISKAELSRKLSVSRAAVSQMFNKTPNITIKKMVEVADAVGIKIKFDLKSGALEALEEVASPVIISIGEQKHIYPLVISSDPGELVIDEANISQFTSQPDMMEGTAQNYGNVALA